MDPRLKALADVLVRVAVRELKTARRAGKEKARAPLIQANGLKWNVPNDSIKKGIVAPSDQR